MTIGKSIYASCMMINTPPYVTMFVVVASVILQVFAVGPIIINLSCP